MNVMSGVLLYVCVCVCVCVAVSTEPGLCYDDSHHCQEYARDGRCTNSALYRYANYCKRSCGLCSESDNTTTTTTTTNAN